MTVPNSRNRLANIALGLLVLFAPVLILAVTLGTLVIFADLALGEITLIEFFELYVIDLLLFAVLGYGVYRLTLWMVTERFPDPDKPLESDDEEAADDPDGHGSAEEQHEI